MHTIQKRLLERSRNEPLKGLKLREIGRLVGVIHPQIVKHHLNQLVKKGLLERDYASPRRSFFKPKIVNIPVLGSANCGEPTMLAEENLEGYLKISPSLIPAKNYGDLFALKAIGDSMNNAKIEGLDPINDGDFIVADKSNPQPSSGDYVVSIIEGAANIKKIVFDKEKRLVYLLSESTKDYPPIVISATDNFFVNGKVIKVIKIPRGGGNI